MSGFIGKSFSSLWEEFKKVFVVLLIDVFPFIKARLLATSFIVSILACFFAVILGLRGVEIFSVAVLVGIFYFIVRLIFDSVFNAYKIYNSARNEYSYIDEDFRKEVLDQLVNEAKSIEYVKISQDHHDHNEFLYCSKNFNTAKKLINLGLVTWVLSLFFISALVNGTAVNEQFTFLIRLWFSFILTVGLLSFFVYSSSKIVGSFFYIRRIFRTLNVIELAKTVEPEAFFQLFKSKYNFEYKKYLEAGESAKSARKIAFNISVNYFNQPITLAELVQIHVFKLALLHKTYFAEIDHIKMFEAYTQAFAYTTDGLYKYTHKDSLERLLSDDKSVHPKDAPIKFDLDIAYCEARLNGAPVSTVDINKNILN